MYNNILGQMDDRLRPVVQIRMVSRDTAIVVRIDTGYEGTVFLPSEEVERLGLTKTIFVRDKQLADGALIAVQVWRGVVQWVDGQKTIEFEICAIDDCPYDSASGLPLGLLGIDMLRGYRVLMDMVPQGTVTISHI